MDPRPAANPLVGAPKDVGSAPAHLSPSSPPTTPPDIPRSALSLPLPPPSHPLPPPPCCRREESRTERSPIHQRAGGGVSWR